MQIRLYGPDHNLHATITDCCYCDGIHEWVELYELEHPHYDHYDHSCVCPKTGEVIGWKLDD
jgi:hypothetical protein